MKHLAYLLLILTILTSCSNNGINENRIITNESLSMESEKLKEKFIPYFSGVWTLSEYIEDLPKTKSPLKSSEKLNGVTVIVFSERPKDEKLEVSSSLNNHEGFGFNIIFTKGANENSLKTDIADYYYNNKGGSSEVEVCKNKSDTTINLCIYNADKRLLKKVAYKKIRESQPKEDYASGIDFYANKLLFEGRFILIGSIHGVKNIEMTADGLLTGFGNYKRYLVITDFVTRVENNLDNINFYRSERDYDNYLYKINSDTITIYKPIFVDEEMITYGYGDLVYKMIRKK